MGHSTYGYREINKNESVEFEVDLVTRKIVFKYWDKNIGFEFKLLSECRDDIQEEIKEMLFEDGIVIAVDDDAESYVVSGLEDVWETEDEE